MLCCLQWDCGASSRLRATCSPGSRMTIQRYRRKKACGTCASRSPRMGGIGLYARRITGKPLRAQGKLPAEQFQQLKKSLDSKGFRNLPQPYGGGVILQDAESFAAELPGPWEFTDHALADHTQRLRWLNADGKNPFPAAIAPVVNWLKHFEPKDGTPFEYTEFQDVCPSVGMSLVQPSVARNSQR